MLFLKRLRRQERGFACSSLLALAGFALMGAVGFAPPETKTVTTKKLPEIVWSREEIGRMPKLLLLNAGGRLNLFVAPNKSAIRPGGKWTAEWGNITASGAYTAPRFMPPYGTDIITYTDPDSVSLDLTVRVLPVAGVPLAKAPIVRPGFSAFPPGIIKVIVLKPGAKMAAPCAYNSAQRLSRESSGKETFYRLPVETYPLAYSPLAARVHLGQPVLRWARETPTYTQEIWESRQRKLR